MKFSFPDHQVRMTRLALSLDGLSVGDAFGERFFLPGMVEYCRANQRQLPTPPWRYTDDTEMALGIAEVLAEHGRLHQDALAERFARRYMRNPQRGYGATAHEILAAIHRGVPWQIASHRAFDGEGSMGNGSAMRVGPLGAYYADSFDAVAKAARASAEVTHAHSEGIAGAIAVAVAAAWAWQWSKLADRAPGEELLRVVLAYTPQGETRRGIEKALTLPLETTGVAAAHELGSGQRVTAPDTVPFTLWCAANHLDDYEEALWTTVAGLGDRDTTCAIVGGIVALSAGQESIPSTWLAARESLTGNY